MKYFLGLLYEVLGTEIKQPFVKGDMSEGYVRQNISTAYSKTRFSKIRERERKNNHEVRQAAFSPPALQAGVTNSILSNKVVMSDR